MARRVAPKSERDIRNWIREGEEGKFYVGGVPGLFLKRQGNYIYWIVKINGREINIAPFDMYSLPLAREKANEYRVLIASGIDPVAHKKTLRAKAIEHSRTQVHTLRNAISNFLENGKPQWSEGTYLKYQYLLSIYKDIESKPLITLTTDQILEPIKREIRDGRATSAHASRRKVIKVLKTVRRQLPPDLIEELEETHDELPPPPQEKHVAADFDEYNLGLILWKIDELPTTTDRSRHMVRRALQLLPYLPARSGKELVTMQWEWINWKRLCIDFPARVMKTRKEFTLPLSDRALEMLTAWHLEAQKPTQGYIFPGRFKGHIHVTSIRGVLRNRLKSGTTSHGFRSVFVTLSRKYNLADSEVLQACIAHTKKSKVERAYDRWNLFPEKQLAMRAWGKFLSNVKARVGKKLHKQESNEYSMDVFKLADIDHPVMRNPINWNEPIDQEE